MEKKKLKNIIFYLIVWGAIALLGLIALNSIFRTGPSSIKMPLRIAILILAAIPILLIYRLKIFSKINTSAFLVILIIIALAPRLVWIYFVQTQPFSDFLHLHDYGINASQGNFKGFVDFYAAFPFKMGFGLVLAGIYSLFGSGLMVAKLFNVILSLILVLLLYAGGKMLYSEKAGRIAALLIAVWPAQIMYTSVIASEHLFMVLFTAAMLLMFKFIKKYSFKNYKVSNGNLILVGIGALTAFAQLVRPMAMILIPVFAVFVLVYKRYRANTFASMGLATKSIILVIISYFVIINLVNIPIQKATGVDVSRSDSGFNLMIGTNNKSSGMFNQEDFQIIEKNNYDFDKVHKEAKQIALERLESDPKQLIKLAIRKFDIQWGNENYGYYWSIAPAQNSKIEALIKSHPRIFYVVSQAFYILIILMAICSCFITLLERRYDALIILMIFGGLVLSYTLLEVQSRYHMPVVPLLILFGTSFLPGTKQYGE